MNVRSVRKYITSDGIEFNSFDDAQAHQEQLNTIGKSVKVGDTILFASRFGDPYPSIGVVSAIKGAIIFLKNLDHIKYTGNSFPIQVGAIHLSCTQILEVVDFKDHIRAKND